MKIVFIVVIYNCCITDSKTISSLCKYIKNNDLIIVNNGPLSVDLDCCNLFKLRKSNVNIKYFEYLENKPLSKLYNEVIDSYEYDKYVILDHDTQLSAEYYEDVVKVNDIMLQLPIIIEKKTQEVFYPVKKNKVIKSNNDMKKNGFIFSIGSGLVLGKNIVTLFRKNNLKLFDEKFALYGVDISFFRRIDLLIRKKNKISMEIISSLIHDLSSISDDNSWRKTERLYDAVLSVVNYPKTYFHLIYHLLRISLLEIKYLRFKNLVLIIKTIINNKHPRC